MTKRLRSAAFAAAVCLCAAPAAAAPFSFTFDMPAWDYDSWAGQTYSMTLIVDNGGSTDINQSYTNAHILDAIFDVNGTIVDTRSWSIDYGTGTNPIATWITTDGAGVAALDLSGGVNSRWSKGNPVPDSGLAQITDLGSIQVRWGGDLGDYVFYNPFTGPIAEAQAESGGETGGVSDVPLPASLPALAAGLTGLFALRRRRG
ncbi:VPLPA-CTERM sorting domain-containing protein [Rhodovulum sp. DZ06]|uniref:VPLPA-CTERM sorting domain-containing protein n=1 Tax=Rhodovulum sp. DZ06 TaxID=3425126 RepID=UPI003D34C7EA